jgi:hypothetical protein
MPVPDHQAARDHLAHLAPDQRLALVHLLSCRLCRHEVGGGLADLLREQPAPAPRHPGQRRSQAQLDIGAIAARTTAAADLAERLALLTPAAARQVIAADAQLRQPLVAACLLARAEEALDDPRQAEQLGEAAQTILCAQEADAAGRNLDMLFRAVWTVLRGRRLRGKIEQAEDAYRSVLPFLGAAPAPTEGRAMLLAALAQLRWDQRRIDEATALFLQAARIFGQQAERQGEAACRAQAGFVLVEQLDPARGRAELGLAHLFIDAELAPALAARVALALAWCDLALGHAARARAHLRAARGFDDRAPGEGEGLFRAWWEARIAAIDGQPEQADALLDSVRRRLLAGGSAGEAARCSLDLLALRVERGRLDGLADLGPDLMNAFPGRPSALQPACMIDLLATWAAQGSQGYSQGEASVRHFLAGLRPHPLDRPELIPRVEDLADHLLIAARQGLALGE